MAKKYIVDLSKDEKAELVSLTQKGRPGAKKIKRANILRRFDYEYRLEGTCNLFMFLQPLAGWRHIKVTDQRTKQDFAWCMKDLVEIHFPEAERIRVVLDNLNTHSPAALRPKGAKSAARGG